MKTLHHIFFVTCVAWIGTSSLSFSESSPDRSEVFQNELGSVSELRQELIDDVLSRIKLAKDGTTVDVQKLCNDLKDIAKQRICTELDIPRLLTEIEFPATAKERPKVTTLNSPLDHQSAVGQILTMIGKPAADACLDELARAKGVSNRERQLYLVIDAVYGPDALQMIGKKVGGNTELMDKIRTLGTGRFPAKEEF